MCVFFIHQHTLTYMSTSLACSKTLYFGGETVKEIWSFQVIFETGAYISMALDVLVMTSQEYDLNLAALFG